MFHIGEEILLRNTYYVFIYFIFCNQKRTVISPDTSFLPHNFCPNIVYVQYSKVFPKCLNNFAQKTDDSFTTRFEKIPNFSPKWAMHIQFFGTSNCIISCYVIYENRQFQCNIKVIIKKICQIPNVSKFRRQSLLESNDRFNTKLYFNTIVYSMLLCTELYSRICLIWNDFIQR